MNIEIKKLAPERAEEYARFFDETPHDDNIDEHKCYCVCWCGENSENRDFSSREKRRAAAVEYVRKNILQGYLAYADGKIAGWCNANTKSDCLMCESWRRNENMRSVPADEPDVKVKSVFCFVIAPEMKRKGLASRLLQRVCEDAARDGFDFAEAYPNKKTIDDIYEFMGPAELYRKSGFSVHFETDEKLVMRKALKQMRD